MKSESILALLKPVDASTASLLSTLMDAELFKTQATAIVEKLEPEIIAHFEGLGVIEKAHQAQTMQDLMAVRLPLTNDAFFTNLATAIDEIAEEQPMAHKATLYMECGKQLMLGGQQFVQEILRQRAQAILRKESAIIKPSSKIILPNGDA
jgi:hypothetical protein